MRYITAAIAIASGLLVLVGYLYPLDVLTQARAILTDWAVVIGAMAVLVGVFNLILVQTDKIRKREKNASYGVVLVLSLVLTILVGIASSFLGMDKLFTQITINAIIVPVEASLMAILAVTLVYASIRLLRRRTDVMTVIFLVVSILFLASVVLSTINPIGDLLLGALNTFSSGGARGLLIGIALGTLLTGLRVLFGIDRPYGGK